MPVKKYSFVYGAIFFCAMLLIVASGAWYIFHKKLPEILENLSAKHETINFVKVNQGSSANATKKQLQDIESRLIQEESEYNEAKRQEELKKRQYDIMAFENSLVTVEKPAKEAYSRQEKVLAQWKIGNAANGEAYEATNAAKEQCEKVRKEVVFIRVPETLPKAVAELLIETKTSLVSCYVKKVEALDFLLKYIDDNKPSYQHKASASFKASREFSASVALNIIEAKRKAGIDLLRETLPGTEEATQDKCSYTINGIFYAEKNPFVFINEKIYYINDPICAGKVIKILPNRVVIKFPEYDKEYRVGDTASR